MLGVRRGTLSAVLLLGAIVALPFSPSGATVEDHPTVSSPQFDGTVYAIARRGSTVYVGGAFQSVTDSTSQVFVRHGLAAFDARTGAILPWDPDVQGTIYDIAIAREGVYLAGKFDKVDGLTRYNLARVARDGAGHAAHFAAATDAPVLTLALSKSRVYLGGSFTSVAGEMRNGAAAVRRKGSHSLTQWNPGATGGAVNEITLVNRGVLVGGSYLHLAGDPMRGYLAKVTKSRGAVIGRFNPGVTAPVYDMAVRHAKIFVAAGGKGGGFVAAYGHTGGKRLWSRQLSGDAAAISASKATLYVGGHFDGVCKSPRTSSATGRCLDGEFRRPKLAALRLDGRVRGWNPGTDSALGVFAVLTKTSRHWLAVGGAFTQVDRQPHSRLAVFN